MCGLEEATWSRLLPSHLFLDMLSKLTVFIPLIGRRWRMLLLGAHLRWARLRGAAGYNHLSMATLDWSTRSCPQLILGTSQIMGSCLASFCPSLLPWRVIFLFSLTVCSLWSGTQVLGTLFWRGFAPQSHSMKWNCALSLANGRDRVQSLPSALKFRCGSWDTCSWNNVSLKKKEAWDSRHMDGPLLVEMDPTGRQSLGTASSRTAPGLCAA